MSSLQDLIPILESRGFLRHYLGFGDANLRAWDWKSFATKVPTECRLLWRFFLCGSRVDAGKLREEIPGELVDRLTELGLCKTHGDKVSLGDSALINYQRRPIFVDTGAPSKARIGDDVHALVSQVFPTKDLDVLSLHSSGGTEVCLYAEGQGGRLSILPTANSVGHLHANFEINGVENEVEVIDSLESVESSEFDMILSRTPSVAVPDGYDFSEIEAAGNDGLEGYRSNFGVAGRSLKPGGKMYFVGLLFGGDSADDVAKQLQKLASESNLVVEAEITSRQRLEPGTNIFNQAIFLAEKRTKKTVRELIDDFMGHYEGNGYAYAYFVKGFASKRDGSSAKRHRIQDLSDRYYGTWAI